MTRYISDWFLHPPSTIKRKMPNVASLLLFRVGSIELAENHVKNLASHHWLNDTYKMFFKAPRRLTSRARPHLNPSSMRLIQPPHREKLLSPYSRGAFIEARTLMSRMGGRKPWLLSVWIDGTCSPTSHNSVSFEQGKNERALSMYIRC